MADFSDTHVYPVAWQADHVVLLDQRQLPEKYAVVAINRSADMLRAIESRIVQGGSALGIAAAYGLYLGALEIPTQDGTAFWERLEAVGEQFKQCRPDKENLCWGVDSILALKQQGDLSVDELRPKLLATAQQMQLDDFRLCQAIGDGGLAALPTDPAQLTLLTHCNHGALATSGYGTSLGVVRSAWGAGRLAQIYAAETRPNFQGVRLTAWECTQEGIPVTVITDSAAAHCLQQGLIDAVLVGADRIAANGDTVNKIGTYSLALAAKAHHVPFFVAAPLSTVDRRAATGRDIPIATHPPQGLYALGNILTPPEAVTLYNPAADMTPAALITAILTEQGAIAPDQLAAHLG